MEMSNKAVGLELALALASARVSRICIVQLRSGLRDAPVTIIVYGLAGGCMPLTKVIGPFID